MREACSLVWLALVGLFRSRASLEAEILILRHQLNIQRRQSPKRLNFSTLDRLIFAGLYRLGPSVLGGLAILKPKTVIRWHHADGSSFGISDRPASPIYGRKAHHTKVKTFLPLHRGDGSVSYRRSHFACSMAC